MPEKEPSTIVNETSETGANRAKLYPKTGKFNIRLDLVFNNPIGLRRLAETYGEGAIKYGPNNWKKGFKESVFISHALEHIRLHFHGDTSEDHIAHACWNLFTLMHFQETKPEMMDITGKEETPIVNDNGYKMCNPCGERSANRLWIANSNKCPICNC